MSFDSRLVAGLKERAPDIVRGIVADRVIDPSWRVLPRRAPRLARPCHLALSRPQFLSFEAAGLPSPASRLFREAGLPVLSWTVRSEAGTAGPPLCDQITFEGFLPR